jgi:hypothetical protein
LLCVHIHSSFVIDRQRPSNHKKRMDHEQLKNRVEARFAQFLLSEQTQGRRNNVFASRIVISSSETLVDLQNTLQFHNRYDAPVMIVHLPDDGDHKALESAVAYRRPERIPNPANK